MYKKENQTRMQQNKHNFLVNWPNSRLQCDTKIWLTLK